MTNYAAAAAVPSGSHSLTLVDDNRKPMIIRLGDATNTSSRKLQIIKEDEGGNRFLFNLASAVSLKPSEKILAFDAKQTSNGSIFLVFATESAPNEALLYIVKPFRALTEVLLNGMLRLECITAPEAKITQSTWRVAHFSLTRSRLRGSGRIPYQKEANTP